MESGEEGWRGGEVGAEMGGGDETGFGGEGGEVGWMRRWEGREGALDGEESRTSRDAWSVRKCDRCSSQKATWPDQLKQVR